MAHRAEKKLNRRLNVKVDTSIKIERPRMRGEYFGAAVPAPNLADLLGAKRNGPN